MVLMMLFMSFAVAQPAGAASVDGKIRLEPIRMDAPHVEGEIVVMLANTQGKSLPSVVAQAFATADRKHAQVMRVTGNGAMVLKVNDGQLATKLDELNSDPAVLYAEPNYTYSVPETSAADSDGYRINSEYVIRSVRPSASSNWSNHKLVSIAELQAMKTKRGARILATYPNDPGVFQNFGWTVVGADIVWPNTAVTPGVCVVDTGVDSGNKDLAGRLLPGYDYVWGDTTPQDDHGHGTHVTGIIAAIANNALGMAGASNAKVAPIKVLDAQGVGTNFDIAAGILNCANRTDIRVINLSLGGPSPSNTLESALNTAVIDKGKLVVVAAGNNASSTPTYPAGYADTGAYPQYANKVIAVAASGKNTVDPIDYDLPFAATNYGAWVSVVAPGGSIYSTTPWDKSFYLNTYAGVETRFGTLSGTSMAAPFVSAAAARYWGYKTTSVNSQVGIALKNPANGTVLTTGAGAWDVSMAGKAQINIAKLLERGAVNAGVVDASIGAPLMGATISAYQGVTLRGSAVMGSGATTDIINLPVPGGTYILKVNKVGYTASPQSAFQHESPLNIIAGTWIDTSDTPAAVPPKSANFAVVLVWRTWQPFDGPTQLETIDPIRGIDLDLDVWLPNSPNPQIGGDQPAKFIVGNESYEFSALGDPYGTMTAFPYARLLREGGFLDSTPAETIAIRNRFAAYGAVSSNAALPYYPDVYSVYVTDYGQTIDHDGDGCGDNYGTQPGFEYDPSYTCVGTQGIPILGTYLTPYIYVWKDGLLAKFADGSNGGSYWPPQDAATPPPDNCNEHWWKALTINSTLAGTATYADNLVLTNPGGECDNGASPNYYPYLFLPEPGRGSAD
jgi:hypothetical protein